MPVTVSTNNLTSFCQEVARYTPGVRFWDAMIHEVGKVLEGCVRLTLKDNWKIIRSIEFKNRSLPAPGQTYGRHVPVIYFNKRGIGWFYDEAGPGNQGKAAGPRNIGKSKTFHPMTEFFHYGDPRWARYESFLAQLKNNQIKIKQVVGRAAQSWVQIAQSLGIRIDVPDYVTNATPFRGGMTHVNGTSKEIRSVNSAVLQMTNINPVLLGTIDGNRILVTSIRNREKYFKHGITEGYLEDVKRTANRYQGLKPSW